MEVLSMPGQFASAFGDLVYTYAGVAEGDVFDAEIVGGYPYETLGVKRFTDTDGIRVNVAGYLRRKLSPAPFVAGNGGFFEDAGRSVRCAVKHDRTYTPVRIYTASLRDLVQDELLTCMPLHRDLAPGEWDEVSFPAQGGRYHASFEASGSGARTFTTTGYATSSVGGIYTFVADYDSIRARIRENGGDPASCRAVHVRIYGEETEIAHIIYVMRQNPTESVRLCWLNPLGGIDGFTFRTVTSRRKKSAKEKIMSEDGYVTASSAVENIMELNSGYQPGAVLEGLAEIIASPRVWECRGGGVVSLDVISDSAVTGSEALAGLMLKVRESAVINYQTF